MTFTRTRALGAGFDDAGEFTYSGGYEGSTLITVSLVKELIPKTGTRSTLTIVGEWTGSFIKAVWWDYDDSSRVGECELWPVDKGLALKDRYDMSADDEDEAMLMRQLHTGIIDFDE